MRTQNGDMISRGFGVRGTNPDIHQRDAAAAFPLQMIGRHLRQFCRLWQRRIGVGDLDIARADKAGVAAVRVARSCAGIGFKFVDVELVVGEQNMVLEMLGGGRRVMRQPRQRIVHPLRGKRGKGADTVRLQKTVPIHDIYRVSCSGPAHQKHHAA